MSLKNDLDHNICQIHELIREYEAIIQTTSDPKELRRSQRIIKEQEALLKDQFTRYASLCTRSNQGMSENVVEIAIARGIPFSSAPPVQSTSSHLASTQPPNAETGSSQNSHALLIGIGAYRYMNSLSKTTTDAQDLRNLLTQVGYPEANIALLLDEQATKPSISDGLEWLARRASADDTVIVFFSGHGVQRPGGFDIGEYLCPVGADRDHLRSTAISDEELTAALCAIPARRLVVFLDACYAGAVGEPKDPNLALKPGFSEKTFEKLAAGEGRVVISSCKPDEVSLIFSDMRNSLFTHYLLEGLRGAAVVRDDSYVGIFDLAIYLHKQVPKRWSQHPVFKGVGIDANFPVAWLGESRPG